MKFSSRTSWDLGPNRLASALAEARAAGREILDLTESNPTRCGFQYNEREILGALSDQQSLVYEPEPRGLPRAREAVAGYYTARGAEISSEQIFLTTSTSEGHSHLFRLLCDAGDEVLAPSPSYPLFDFLAALDNVRLVRYPLVYDHGWQIDLHALEQAITPRTRAVMLVHPNNPTGSYVSAGERDALNALCRERGLALVADEVFLDYPHDGPARTSFAGNAEALTFVLSGLSKIAALPQMKAAWVAASGPQELVAAATARLEVIADTFLSMNAPVQHALPVLLAQRVNEQIQARVARNLAELDRQLGAQKPVSRLNVEAGWYAVLRVPAVGNDDDLAVELVRREGVLAHPGHFYDFQREGFLVVSLIAPVAAFAEGMKRVLRVVG
ncbi:MAG TPA: pyridoxal phosphate-dependent aminotransferase [Terriglobales bacterium]|nr:pyridoxal phosphate-dependent aminotransferase [Terriglobales bacterium]